MAQSLYLCSPKHTSLSHGLMPLSVRSFPWQIYPGFDISSILGSPMVPRLSFSQLHLEAFQVLLPYQGLHIRTPLLRLPDLSIFLKLQRACFYDPHLCISQASKVSTLWMTLTSSPASFQWTLTPFNHISISFS